MAEVSFIGTVTNGSLNQECKDAIQKLLRKIQNGRQIRIGFRDYKKPSSNNQRAFYRGTVIPAVIEALYELGNDFVDKEIAHEACKELFMPPTGIRQIKIMGRLVEKRSTTWLNTEEMKKYTDSIIAWLASQGIQVLYPDERKNG